jgi:methyl-accepting chemotaxis protein
VLKKIKESIDKITSSTENVINRFQEIDRAVKIVADQEEQGQGSKQILEAIGQVNEVTQMVRGGSLEMLEGAKEVIQESKNLERTSQEISSGMNEMAAGANQMNIAVTNVNELSVKNREGINTLTKEVSRFKVE